MYLGQIDGPRHAPNHARSASSSVGSNIAGGDPGRPLVVLLLLAPQRGRIDDACDNVAERLHHAHRRLCRRLYKEATRARRERCAFCRRHLSGVFLQREEGRVCVSGAGAGWRVNGTGRDGRESTRTVLPYLI